MKVLIIRLSAIGDTIHSLPVAAAIKRRIPEAQIGWVVEPMSAPLVTNNPAVDEVFVLPRKGWIKKLASPLNWASVAQEAHAFWSDIRNKNYDVVLDMQGLLKSALCTVASGAPKRIGFSHTREGAGLFLTDKVEVGNYFALDKHIVRVNLEIASYLFRTLGLAPTIKDEEIEFPLPEIPETSRQKIDKLLTGQSNVAVLLPGTTWTSKIWTSQKWIDLAGKLCEIRMPLILAGGPSEKKTNSAIADSLKSGGIQVLDVTGETSLLDLIALYQKSRLVIGLDSGPMHLAAAVGMPKVVGIFGATPYKRLEPLGPQSRAVSLHLSCQPCFEAICPLSTNACLEELSANEVMRSVNDLLLQ
ncbi:MAG: glycosyltransferase family 9 protein [Candidatus Obscuribacterales bacterium]|nr:glycosyltransferase family 9 protein [Candidatus Obscuribacterales bacterium]